MKQITLPLVWLTIRIDIVPATLRRAKPVKPIRLPSDPEPVSSLRERLSPHLLRDIGLDWDRGD